ncbi:hypothetical protein ACIQAC_17125 [Streptomyces sp. NPDC088387]|uniref:hypothetical protein n=1 Tax=Streptomyces sp. NPDC088387 TaxID=3365859 RepID=UPI0038061CB0
MPSHPHHLTLRVVVPESDERGGTVEVRPIIDGIDVLADAFDEGPAEDPQSLLTPSSPLLPSQDAREVRLAEAECTEGCCGAAYVTITRVGDAVVWNNWRNPDGELELPEYRFDMRQYEAEVRRAVADRGWEWPARTVARLLEENLRRHPESLGRWECELAWVAAPLWEPARVNVALFHPRRPNGQDERPWLQFRRRLTVSGDAPDVQVRRLLRELLDDDPKETGEVCGGSREFARELGYPWLTDLR